MITIYQPSTISQHRTGGWAQVTVLQGRTVDIVIALTVELYTPIRSSLMNSDELRGVVGVRLLLGVVDGC